MPLVAMEWNQPITSPNPGLEDPAPGWPAAPSADTPLIARAAPAIPADAQATPLTLVDLPLDNWDSTQATLSSSSADLRTSLAWPSRSGILKAMEGIWLAYSSGTSMLPRAEKEPDGTTVGDNQPRAPPGMRRMQLDLPGHSFST